jgi:site-specific recombinase XerD
MSYARRKIPAYCLHRASQQAVVRLNGKDHDHYLGPFGSPESHKLYERRIAEWNAQQALLPPRQNGKKAARQFDFTVRELVDAYLKHASTYYSRDGKTTQEFRDMEYALEPVKTLYGESVVSDFGPLALKAVRGHMISERKLSRSVINHRINRIRRAFKWAVSEELAPAGCYEALRTVDGLRFGRTEARETKPVQPVEQKWVDATLPYLSRQVAAMVNLQQLAAMRPGEVVLMRHADIEKDPVTKVWIYRPYTHKNRWRGHERAIPLGPLAQKIIEQFSQAPDDFLFRPIDAENERNASRRERRKSPRTPSQNARKVKPQPKRAKRQRYDRDSYRRAITYAVKKANRDRQELFDANPTGSPYEPIPNWCPLQLRHTSATQIRKQFGIEGAQVMLGHSRADVTQVYAERDFAKAVEIAKSVG